MAYEPTNWTNGSGEPISAENLNHIETGISDAHEDIDNISSNLTSLTNTVARKLDDEDLILIANTKALGTVKAGTYYTETYEIKKDGYRCLGVVGWNINGTGASYQSIYALTTTGGSTAGNAPQAGKVTIYYEARNNYGKAFTGTLITRTLWVKNK